ncbi:transporter substrate-binding domain-containing protein [Clostridium butyricum]|uniref:transporter substrate-binding domain-containing protein n=1 Tax=Clostridium butyricum TaxID=1492 RepID=UPI0009031054|nr:transporter substrate-binding domain-containing protein [Clostridium butyricum]APF24834.1 bacterial extracellular solute-binding s, 3 family protein [Clostridium butyricum]
MKKGRLLLAIMSLMLLTVLFTACGKNTKDINENTTSNDETKPKYIIACDSNFPPFSFEENGTYTGIDVELLEAISKKEDFDYELKPMDFGSIISGLSDGTIDGAMGAISITDERKEILDFSEEYFESGLSMGVKHDDTSISKFEDLQGKNVAVKKGTAGSEFAEDNKEKYSLNLKYFDNSQSMFLDVEEGSSDAVIEDHPIIAYEVKKATPANLKIAGDKLKTFNYGFAVNKGKNQELLDKFNKGLNKVRADAEYEKIVSQYIVR